MEPRPCKASKPQSLRQGIATRHDLLLLAPGMAVPVVLIPQAQRAAPGKAAQPARSNVQEHQPRANALNGGRSVRRPSGPARARRGIAGSAPTRARGFSDDLCYTHDGQKRKLKSTAPAFSVEAARRALFGLRADVRPPKIPWISAPSIRDQAPRSPSLTPSSPPVAEPRRRTAIGAQTGVR